MSYYQGDYGFSQLRRAGVYRGDPGFFSFLGNLAKSAVSLIPGVGPIASKAIEAVSGAAAHATPGIIARSVETGRGAIIKAGSTIAKHPVLTAAGAAGAIGAAGIGAGLEHRLLGGGRKRKRMNVYNPRALRRALRRAHGFAKMARRIIRVPSHYKHPNGFNIGQFKKKSRNR